MPTSNWVGTKIGDAQTHCVCASGSRWLRRAKGLASRYAPTFKKKKHRNKESKEMKQKPKDREKLLIFQPQSDREMGNKRQKNWLGDHRAFLTSDSHRPEHQEEVSVVMDGPWTQFSLGRWKRKFWRNPPFQPLSPFTTRCLCEPSEDQIKLGAERPLFCVQFNQTRLTGRNSDLAQGTSAGGFVLFWWPSVRLFMYFKPMI